MSKEGFLSPEKVKLMVENLQVLHEEVFTTDKAMALGLQAMNYDQFKPLGVVLVSSNQNCQECGGGEMTSSWGQAKHDCHLHRHTRRSFRL